MKLIRKNIKLITIIVFILIITGIFILKKMLVKSASIEENLLANEELEIKEEPDIIHEEVSEVKPLNYVDIKGEVINPGVYEITPNMRVQDQRTSIMIQRLGTLFVIKHLISTAI